MPRELMYMMTLIHHLFAQGLKHRPPTLQLHTQVLHSGKNKRYTKPMAFVDPNERHRTHRSIAGISPPVYYPLMIPSIDVMHRSHLRSSVVYLFIE